MTRAPPRTTKSGFLSSPAERGIVGNYTNEFPLRYEPSGKILVSILVAVSGFSEVSNDWGQRRRE